MFKCRINFSALLRQPFGKKKRVVLLILYLCAVVHVPPGEKQHYSFIRSNEAKPCRSRKSQLNCSKMFIIATDYEIFLIRFIGVCVSTAMRMCVPTTTQIHKGCRLELSISKVNRKSWYTATVLHVLQEKFHELERGRGKNIPSFLPPFFHSVHLM